MEATAIKPATPTQAPKPLPFIPLDTREARALLDNLQLRNTSHAHAHGHTRQEAAVRIQRRSVRASGSVASSNDTRADLFADTVTELPGHHTADTLRLSLLAGDPDNSETPSARIGSLPLSPTEKLLRVGRRLEHEQQRMGVGRLARARTSMVVVLLC